MSNIHNVFEDFQETIKYESDIKSRLSEIEQCFNTSISSIRGKYFDLSFKTPVKLSNEDYAFQKAGGELSFQDDELSQLDHEYEHEQSENTGINNLNLLSTLHEAYSRKLNDINCSAIFSDKLGNHITEEILYLMLLNRYYKVIAFHFNENIIQSEKTSIPLVSQSSEGSLGLIMTPNEAETLLKIESINYSTYLICLLRLVDQIVDYTREVLISISINSKSLSNVESKQYALSLVNLKIISKIQNGFLMLELKNDFVRRRYDGLKYNLKRMNGIVYDLTLRNLIHSEIDVV